MLWLKCWRQMRKRGARVWSPWLSWHSLTQRFGPVALASYYSCALKLCALWVLRALQDSLLSKLSRRWRKQTQKCLEIKWLNWSSTSSPPLPWWWQEKISPTNKSWKLGLMSLRKKFWQKTMSRRSQLRPWKEFLAILAKKLRLHAAAFWFTSQSTTKLIGSSELWDTCF